MPLPVDGEHARGLALTVVHHIVDIICFVCCSEGLPDIVRSLIPDTGDSVASHAASAFLSFQGVSVKRPVILQRVCLVCVDYMVTRGVVLLEVRRESIATEVVTRRLSGETRRDQGIS